MKKPITIGVIAVIATILVTSAVDFSAIGAKPTLDIISEAEILIIKATGLAEIGDYQGALRFVDQALAIEPNNFVILNYKGWILMQAEKPEEALVWFDKALEVDPENTLSLENKVNALNELGKQQLGLEKPEEALVWFDKALEVDPNAAYVLNNKGLALYKLGDSVEAISYYDRALTINPYYELAKENKKLALDEPKGILGILLEWDDLIFELALGGAALGGVAIWKYMKKRKRRILTEQAKGGPPV